MLKVVLLRSGLLIGCKCVLSLDGSFMVRVCCVLVECSWALPRPDRCSFVHRARRSQSVVVCRGVVVILAFWPLFFLRIVFFLLVFFPRGCAVSAPVVRWVVDSLRVSVGLGTLLSSTGAVGGLVLASD